VASLPFLWPAVPRTPRPASVAAATLTTALAPSAARVIFPCRLCCCTRDRASSRSPASLRQWVSPWLPTTKQGPSSEIRKKKGNFRRRNDALARCSTCVELPCWSRIIFRVTSPVYSSPTQDVFFEQGGKKKKKKTQPKISFCIASAIRKHKKGRRQGAGPTESTTTTES